MRLTNDDVQEILQLLNTSFVNEMHLRTERFDLTLRRSGDGEWMQACRELSAPHLLPPAAGTEAPASAPVTRKSARAVADGLVEVRAPLLGTFYRSPKPGSPPFVEIGSRVEKDMVIAIVETMKLMNSVLATASGTIVEICLGDADFADHDAVLMRIQPEGI